MTLAQSLTPRSNTVWLPSGMPASASIAQARVDSGVISLGWLKCVFRYSGWYLCSISQSAGVMRCGQTTGMRDPRRTISTCGISVTFCSSHSRRSSDRVSGSPPLSRTSRTSGLRRM